MFSYQAVLPIQTDPKFLISCTVIILFVVLVNRIKEETKTAIIIPNDSEKKSLIRIEGSPEGVKKAKAEILELAKKLVGSKSYCIAPLILRILALF